MRIQWLVALCLVTPGCRVFENACRTLVREPLAYCEHRDRHASYSRSRELAESAWAAVAESCTSQHVSPDYADGFKYGFTEYVYAGGRALPPPLPLPPRKYWGAKYQTPEGHNAMQAWLAGFYEGTARAQEFGYREWMTLPSAIPAPAVPPLPPPAVVEPALPERDPAVKPLLKPPPSPEPPVLEVPPVPQLPEPDLPPKDRADEEPSPKVESKGGEPRQETWKMPKPDPKTEASLPDAGRAQVEPPARLGKARIQVRSARSFSG
jgi:hypothetical protein